MTKYFTTVVLLTGFCGLAVMGCRQKAVQPVAVSQSPEASHIAAQQQRTQKYITQRRAAARKNNRSHTVH